MEQQPRPLQSPTGGRRSVRGLTPAAARYVVVGVALNAASIGIFTLLWSTGAFRSPTLVNLLTSTLVFPAWFAANRMWVFKSQAPVPAQLIRAVASYGGAMLASAVIIFVISSGLGLAPVVAQCLTIGTLVVGSFIINALWTFAHTHK